MLRVSDLHWWEDRHPQCCTTFSSMAGAQHQPHEEKEGRSHKTPALLQCQDFCLRRLPAQEVFAVPTFLVKRMHGSFAMGTLLQKPPTRTTPMDRLLISRAFLLCTHVHLVTQESQLCSCLRKSKWNANRYHNDVHCTYCKHRTKRRISGIESPLHSCWDKTTVKNRRGGSGTPEWNPPLATPLLPGRKKALNRH